MAATTCCAVRIMQTITFNSFQPPAAALSLQGCLMGANDGCLACTQER